MRNIIRSISLAALLAVSWPVASFAQDEGLTAGQVLALAETRASEGNVQEALALIDALLVRNPSDTGALLLLARIGNAAGDDEAAAEFAARAYSSTDAPIAKYNSARLAAISFANDERDTQAMLWLRRARQYAPNAAEAQAVADDFRFLRQRNPLSVDLRFGLSPSNNINDGSVNDSLFLISDFGPVVLPFSRDAQALSGLEISAGVGLQYRLAADQRSGTFLTADLDGRTYRISNQGIADLEEEIAENLAACRALTPVFESEPPESVEARQQACLARTNTRVAKGSDFSDVTLSFGITHRRILRDGMEPTTFRLSASQLWYGGEGYTRSLDANVSQSWRLGDADSLRLSFGAQERRGVQDSDGDGEKDVPPTRSYSLTGSWSRILDSGDRVGLSLGGTQSRSDFASSDYDALWAAASYDLANPVAGMRIGFGLSYEDRQFSSPSFSNDNRRDETWSGQINVVFDQIEYFGFQPVMRVEASRTDSNSPRFEQESLSISFDLQSAF